MDSYILSCLPQHIRVAVDRLPESIRHKVAEIRIRIARPVEIVIGQRSSFLAVDGSLHSQAGRGMVATEEDGKQLLNQISRHSLYAKEEELRRGYMTIAGGHRVGIAGRVVLHDGNVHFMRDIRSFNIRIARQKKGVANHVLPSLVRNGRLLNTLIISPPGCGKTTLLRDLIRVVSHGSNDNQLRGLRVGVVDERSEIGSCHDGIPQNELGPRTDVLDACPKAEGMMMLIRSMSPEVLACDEIGHVHDAGAVLEAVTAGVRVLVTTHGQGMSDIRKRPSLQELLTAGVFERYIFLSNRQGPGTVEAVCNAHFEPLPTQARAGVTVCYK